MHELIPFILEFENGTKCRLHKKENPIHWVFKAVHFLTFALCSHRPSIDSIAHSHRNRTIWRMKKQIRDELKYKEKLHSSMRLTKTFCALAEKYHSISKPYALCGPNRNCIERVKGKAFSYKIQVYTWDKNSAHSTYVNSFKTSHQHQHYALSLSLFVNMRSLLILYIQCSQSTL